MAVEISIILAIRFWPRALGEGMMRKKERTGEGHKGGPRVAQNIRSWLSFISSSAAKCKWSHCSVRRNRRGGRKGATRALKYRNAVGVLSTDLSRPAIVSGFVS